MDGESGAGRWPTVGGRSKAANWEPARGGGDGFDLVARWVGGVHSGAVDGGAVFLFCILMLFLHPPHLPVIAS